MCPKASGIWQAMEGSESIAEGIVTIVGRERVSRWAGGSIDGRVGR